MTLKRRIGELEQRTGTGKQVVIWVTYEGEPEPTEAQKEAAIASYKAKNPDWKEGDFIVLYWKDIKFQALESNLGSSGGKLQWET
jgi:hypothetical protein